MTGDAPFRRTEIVSTRVTCREVHGFATERSRAPSTLRAVSIDRALGVVILGAFACHRSKPVDPAATTPDAAVAAACPSPVAPDPHQADRLACRFVAGARAADTVAVPAALPIKH